MTRIYKNNSRSYSDLKAELHRAKDKLSHLSNDLERLEEENAVLRESLANALPMYHEHYHEEKHAAFQLGKDTQRSLSKPRGVFLFCAGMGLAWLVELTFDLLKIL